jgi:DNA polymerase III subunit beta
MTATATKAKVSSTTVTIQKAELLDALVAIKPATPSRPARPILANCRIGDGLISGTDLEVRIDRAIGEVCEPFLVPHERLLAIVRAATGDDVKLTQKDTSVTVQCGGGKWTLPTEDVAEYPTWEPADLKTVCRLPADQFSRAARATTYATDSDSSRYALGAVMLEIVNGNPTWVATDGRRLACVETETDQAVDDRYDGEINKQKAKYPGLLTPRRVLDIVATMATGDGSVQIEANSKEVRFDLDGTTVTGTLIEGRFPRWRDVVGEPEGQASVVHVQELLAAVRSAAIVTSEQSKGIDLAWAGDKLTLSARSAEYGESTVKCDIVAAGSTSSTKLDPRYVAEFLRSISADEEPQVDVYATDRQSRVLFRCGPYTGVVMPLAADA